MELGIAAYSHIDSLKVVKNGDILLQNTDNEVFSAYSKNIYRSLDLSYPKFFKMDELCKLAFLAAEVLLTDKELHSENEGADIAIILGNRSSSIASDTKHFESIKNREDYFPSPAVFVYTLPNIMLGELCIRHSVTGENTCFLMETFNTAFFYHYIKNIFKNEEYKYCITGWVDYQEENFIADLYLIQEMTSDNQYVSKFKTDFIKSIAT